MKAELLHLGLAFKSCTLQQKLIMHRVNHKNISSPVNRINSYGTGPGQMSNESPFVLSIFIHRLDLSLLHTGPVYSVSNPIHCKA